jgi:hypothetical protein
LQRHPAALLAEAREPLDVSVNFDRAEVIAAFRRLAKCRLPDSGGGPEQFRRLVAARDRLLASLGTLGPAPTMAAFAPLGVKVQYHRVSTAARRLAQRRRLIRAILISSDFDFRR